MSNQFYILMIFGAAFWNVFTSSVPIQKRSIQALRLHGQDRVNLESDKQPPAEGQGEGAATGAPQPKPQSKRMQQTQAQVDEVVEIMKVNLDKVIERDTKLSSLDDRADALQEGASQFEKSAATLKSKMWWKNMKMMIIMGVIVVIIVILIIGCFKSTGHLRPAIILKDKRFFDAAKTILDFS